MISSLTYLVRAIVAKHVIVTDVDLVKPHPVFGSDEASYPKLSHRRGYKPECNSVDKRLEPRFLPEHFQDAYSMSGLEVPESFDIRNVNGVNMSSRDLQQHMPVYCGGCWAYGTTSALADRFKYMRRGAWPDVNLSIQSMLNCGKFAGTCQEGGADNLVYRYALEFGFVDDTCSNNFGMSLPCSDLTRCMNCDPPAPEQGWPHGKCYPQQRYRTYHVSAFSALPVNDIDAPSMIEQMKAEIYARGPISCQIAAGPMEAYISGIISTPARDSGDIDHVVSVSGWDRDDATGQEYWIVRNSWGTHWGELGWFRVALGQNALQLESGCTFGIPDWPPKVYEVPSDRMFFTNGLRMEIPEWLSLIDESNWTYNEDATKHPGLVDTAVEAQRVNMKKDTLIQGLAFKLKGDAWNMPFVQEATIEKQGAKWARDHSGEL